MNTEEFEIVSLAGVPQRQRRGGPRVAALLALRPGEAIRITPGDRDAVKVRSAWSATAHAVLGPGVVQTRYVDGYLYIWLKGDRDA